MKKVRVSILDWCNKHKGHERKRVELVLGMNIVIALYCFDCKDCYVYDKGGLEWR